ncbi:HAD family hydrolase [Amycolatopsis jejuensis]|uniref:HAD family hydrolase n=1 Tax=Amycolatopsis jejuensis TaxID=330084 RepID=UPI000526BD3B|nr:HAD hydrolase family protein [Amycolatopsis jejuensis]
MTDPAFAWLVTDLDGTLVDRQLRIVPRSARALERFRRAGGTVVIATGRNEESAGRYHRELELDTPMILYNGARVVAPGTGERLLDLHLGDRWPLLRGSVLPALPQGIGAVAFSGQTAHVVRYSPALADYTRRDGIELSGAPVTGPVTKVMLIGCPDGLAGLVRKHVPDVRLLRSERTYLEVLPWNAGKGGALRFLARRHGVPLHRIAAIGDNPNDLDMLLTAGLGAAVGDGHPSVREQADLVVSPCAQGAVADLVDHLLVTA